MASTLTVAFAILVVLAGGGQSARGTPWHLRRPRPLICHANRFHFVHVCTLREPWGLMRGACRQVGGWRARSCRRKRARSRCRQPGCGACFRARPRARTGARRQRCAARGGWRPAPGGSRPTPACGPAAPTAPRWASPWPAPRPRTAAPSGRSARRRASTAAPTSSTSTPPSPPLKVRALRLRRTIGVSLDQLYI